MLKEDLDMQRELLAVMSNAVREMAILNGHIEMYKSFYTSGLVFPNGDPLDKLYTDMCRFCVDYMNESNIKSCFECDQSGIRMRISIPDTTGMFAFDDDVISKMLDDRRDRIKLFEKIMK